uniref:Uncharacterized protein n=1 Tax=Arundo donax TaxID=35708 RepID=A0A0A9BUZ7_ARUDO
MLQHHNGVMGRLTTIGMYKTSAAFGAMQCQLPDGILRSEPISILQITF